MQLTTNFEMTERRRRRRPKVVPRAAADFIRQLKMTRFVKNEAFITKTINYL